MTWGMGGWLLFPFLQKVGPARAPGAERAGRRRAEDDLRQPLLAASSRWPRRCALDNIAVYNKRATGEKVLIEPHRG